MKSRTLLLPVALAVPALFSTLPESSPAIASEPIAARPNPLLGELDTVVAGARDASILLDGHVVAVVPATASAASSQCKTKHGSLVGDKNAKLTASKMSALLHPKPTTTDPNKKPPVHKG